MRGASYLMAIGTMLALSVVTEKSRASEETGAIVVQYNTNGSVLVSTGYLAGPNRFQVEACGINSSDTYFCEEQYATATYGSILGYYFSDLLVDVPCYDGPFVAGAVFVTDVTTNQTVYNTLNHDYNYTPFTPTSSCSP